MVCIGGILGIGCLDKILARNRPQGSTRVFCKTMEVEEIRTSFWCDSGQKYISPKQFANKSIVLLM